MLLFAFSSCNNDSASNSNKESATNDTAKQEEQKEEEEKTTPPTVEATSGLPARYIDEDAMAVVLNKISDDITAQNLDYVREKGQDCSGIYHKIKDRLQKEFAPFGDANKYHFPTYEDDRDSRQVAQWYHDNGNLKLVKDGLADGNLLRPGAVVFFGQNNKAYSPDQINIDYLTDPNQGIYHIATVTSVEKDDAGNVIKYTMMHGRSPGKTASRTGGNHGVPGSNKTNARHKKYPFGNADQQWVAIAYMETLKEGADAGATAAADAGQAATDTEANTNESTANEVTEANAPSATETTITAPPSSGSGTTSTAAGGGLPARNQDEERLSVVLDLIAQELEAQKLAYISSKGQDCSGIYHKIKDMIQKRFKPFGDRSKYHYPSFDTDRNSRQIAHWYHQNGNLRMIKNAKADANKIHPGTVMFYGRSAETYNNISIEMLTNPGKFIHDRATGLGKIMHIAVVTKVEKDDAGNVTRYTIMHGRNSKHNASRTGSNYDGPGFEKQHAKFPFGNWNQQWVAMAYIETPK
jgi:hypothetical protein